MTLSGSNIATSKSTKNVERIDVMWLKPEVNHFLWVTPWIYMGLVHKNIDYLLYLGKKPTEKLLKITIRQHLKKKNGVETHAEQKSVWIH